MTKRKIKELLRKYNKGTCSSEERDFLNAWYAQWNQYENEQLSILELERELNSIQKNLVVYTDEQQDTKIKKIMLWYKIAAACIIVGVITISYILFQNNSYKRLDKATLLDIKPGSNQAILTLSNGKKIALGKGQVGQVAEESKISVIQRNGNLISYQQHKPDMAVDHTPFYNLLVTPRGGVFQLLLSDGTKVWLNAASSIRYPVKFIGKERTVEITGEVYFEVLHDVRRTFNVIAGGQKVQDIGTHFDINSYPDEPAVITTLVEGSVKVFSGRNSAILSPGQQSQIMLQANSDKIKVTNDVNLNQALAWKNGYFIFHDTKVDNLMRQISRWYDIDVRYTNGVPDKKLSGIVSRNLNISHMVDILRFFKLDFQVKKSGNKQEIIINNN